ncbi:hypothetical protein P3L10_015058 [Capsicum annuum]
MNVDVSPVKVTTKVSKKQSVKTTSGARPNKKTLKEIQEKEYSFLDSDVSEILDELLEHKLIELPEMKRPNEDGRTNDPNYCKYHRLVSHPMEKCFVFKVLIKSLLLGSLDPLQVYVEEHNKKILEPDRSSVDEGNDEGWTLVTRHRRRRMSLQKESSEQPTRRRMVKKPRKQRLVEFPKKTRVTELHHQKPRRPVTLEEFLPSWFRVKTAQFNLKPSCFNTAKEGAKGENLPMEVSSPSKKLAETLGEEAHVCDTNKLLLVLWSHYTLNIYIIHYKVYIVDITFIRCGFYGHIIL